MRILAALTTLTALLAAQPSGCAPSATPKACDVAFAGLTVQAGKVWDTVTATCDAGHRPLRHMLQAWIEYKRFDDFVSYDRAATTWPDRGGQGVRAVPGRHLSDPRLHQGKGTGPGWRPVRVRGHWTVQVPQCPRLRGR